MTTEETYSSPFETAKKINEEGKEYWSARELAKILGYTEYGKFRSAIKRAEIACENSDQKVVDHFAHVSDMITVGKGARRRVANVNLSRYACYLIIQNADPSKEIVALGQTYFALQTHKQEQMERFEDMSEERRRLFLRDQLISHSQILQDVAGEAGVVTKTDFAIFEEHGYQGLYGGEKISDIQKRKNIQNEENVVDYMNSVELAANLFRSTLTEAKLKIDAVSDKATANETHYKVGAEVRETIKRIDGTMPENLPTPKESIQALKGKTPGLLQANPNSTSPRKSRKKKAE